MLRTTINMVTIRILTIPSLCHVNDCWQAKMFHCGHVYYEAEDISYTQPMQFKVAYRTPEIKLNSIRQQNSLPQHLAICFTDRQLCTKSSVQVKLSMYKSWKHVGRRMELRLHSLLTRAQDGGECCGCSADILATLSLGKVVLVSTE
jgi:hypothetical protein